MRLIDADELKKQIAGMTILNNYSPKKTNALCELIDKQPTVQLVDKLEGLLEQLAEEEDFAYADFDAYAKSIHEDPEYDSAYEDFYYIGVKRAIYLLNKIIKQEAH